jgi:hypothetical protein
MQVRERDAHQEDRREEQEEKRFPTASDQRDHDAEKRESEDGKGQRLRHADPEVP